MDQPAQSIDANDDAVTLIPGDSRLRRLERESTMRSFCVVVARVLSEDPMCMALHEDQEVVHMVPITGGGSYQIAANADEPAWRPK